MTIKVNKAMCIGCGACISIDPDHFEFDEDGSSKVKEETIQELTDEVKEAVASCPTIQELTDELREAVASCPTNAIKIEEEEEKSE